MEVKVKVGFFLPSDQNKIKTRCQSWIGVARVRPAGLY